MSKFRWWFVLLDVAMMATFLFAGTVATKLGGTPSGLALALLGLLESRQIKKAWTEAT